VPTTVDSDPRLLVSVRMLVDSELVLVASNVERLEPTPLVVVVIDVDSELKLLLMVTSPVDSELSDVPWLVVSVESELIEVLCSMAKVDRELTEVL